MAGSCCGRSVDVAAAAAEVETWTVVTQQDSDTTADHRPVNSAALNCTQPRTYNRRHHRLSKLLLLGLFEVTVTTFDST